MKIAIITLNDNNNYGNRLQNYALQKFLNKYFSDDVTTIWYEKNSYMHPINIWNWKSFIKFIINKNNFRNYLKYTYILDCIRMNYIQKFTKKITTVFEFDINKISNKYDYFIVGSDQVWNPYFGSRKQQYIRLLKFVPKEKSIAYAASFGISSLPNEFKEVFKQSLNEMKAISVRENAGVKIIKDLAGIDVPVVVDPTLLLTREEWQKITLKPEWYNNEKYILTYFLGNPSPIIEKIAKDNDWKIYNLMDTDNLDLYTSRVEEFIYLIEHAQLVCTDSFHASVFSIIMNTPFLVVNRQQKGVADMSSRIDTLLNLFNFKDRYLTNGKCNLSDKQILNMDFSNVGSIQNKERARSIAYLKEAMNLE